jgi:hypothetical protein
MKNRKREICTSGSVRDEAGQPPHLLGGSVLGRRGRWRRRRNRATACGASACSWDTMKARHILWQMVGVAQRGRASRHQGRGHFQSRALGQNPP